MNQYRTLLIIIFSWSHSFFWKTFWMRFQRNPNYHKKSNSHFKMSTLITDYGLGCGHDLWVSGQTCCQERRLCAALKPRGDYGSPVKGATEVNSQCFTQWPNTCQWQLWAATLLCQAPGRAQGCCRRPAWARLPWNRRKGLSFVGVTITHPSITGLALGPGGLSSRDTSLAPRSSHTGGKDNKGKSKNNQTDKNSESQFKTLQEKTPERWSLLL